MKLFNKYSLASMMGSIIVALCSVTALPQGRNGGTIQPGALAHEVDSKGAAAVVTRLNAGGSQEWEQVINKIETGSLAWLKIAEKLLSGTDAGRTEDLYFALSIALTHNPVEVLDMTGPKLQMEKVCSVPYIEPSPKVVNRYKASARLALWKVTSPELEQRRTACLRLIEGQ